jgi:hypothetical protein
LGSGLKNRWKSRNVGRCPCGGSRRSKNVADR